VFRRFFPSFTATKAILIVIYHIRSVITRIWLWILAIWSGGGISSSKTILWINNNYASFISTACHSYHNVCIVKVCLHQNLSSALRNEDKEVLLCYTFVKGEIVMCLESVPALIQIIFADLLLLFKISV